MFGFLRKKKSEPSNAVYLNSEYSAAQTYIPPAFQYVTPADMQSMNYPVKPQDSSLSVASSGSMILHDSQDRNNSSVSNATTFAPNPFPTIDTRVMKMNNTQIFSPVIDKLLLPSDLPGNRGHIAWVCRSERSTHDFFISHCSQEPDRTICRSFSFVLGTLQTYPPSNESVHSWFDQHCLGSVEHHVRNVREALLKTKVAILFITDRAIDCVRNNEAENSMLLEVCFYNFLVKTHLF